MSEMLANHYFMIRDYERAIEAYEKVISVSGASKTIRKKIIICYIRTFHPEKALAEFLQLVEDDVNFIINTDMTDDDCPCPEIIKEVENGEIHFDKFHKDLVLGILWLYCDKEESIQYLEKAHSHNPLDTRINQLISKLKSDKNQEQASWKKRLQERIF